MVCLSKFTTSECCPTSALCRIDVDQPAQLESRLPHRSMVADMFLTESRKTMFLRSPFSERTSVSQCGPQTLHYSLVWVKILFAHVYYDKSSFWLVAWSNLIRASPPPPYIRAPGLALQQQAALDGQFNMKGTPPLHRWVCSIPWHILLPCIFLAGGRKCTCQRFND